MIQSKALQVYSKYNIFKNSKAEIENALNMINTSSRNNFYKCNGDLTKLATILSGVSAELYMNSVNLKDKNPRQVEEILQKGYYLYNETKLMIDHMKLTKTVIERLMLGLEKKMYYYIKKVII